MITELRVSNYGCLGRDVRVSFGRLTALVGPNGSGKSTVTDVLGFVRDAMHMGLAGAVTDRGGIAAVRRHSSGHPLDVSIQLEVTLPGNGGSRAGHGAVIAAPAGHATYGFELAGDKTEDFRVKWEDARVELDGQESHFRVEQGRWSGPEGLSPQVDELGLALPAVGGDARFRPLLELLKSMTVYSIFPDTLRAPQKYSPEKPMRRHGENWVSILSDQPKETWKPELVAALKKLTGDIQGIRISKTAGFLVVELEHAPGEDSSKARRFGAAQESDGTLRVAGMVTALLQEPPLPVIGIEEPELTVHPEALPLLLDYLRQATRRSQVIITSHSPELLDHLDVDEVRVVERVKGVTQVTKMSERQKETVRSGLLKLGELMVTEGLQQELSLGRTEPPRDE